MSFRTLLAALGALAATGWAQADYQVTLTNVHLCCNSCVRNAKDAAAGPAVTVDANKADHTVRISAPTQAAAQRAVDALAAAGFYGQPSDPAIHLADAKVPDGTVNGLKVSGVELCCNGCVKDVNKAVATVKGVTGTTAKKDEESFEITGTFNAREVVDALHAAGFSAQVE